MEMVGIVGGGGVPEQVAGLLNDLKLQTDVSTKIDLLKRLKEIFLRTDASVLREFVPLLMDFKADDAVPVKSYLAKVIEEIGLKHSEHSPPMVPALIALLHDDSPTVVRHAISASSNLFKSLFLEIAKQIIYVGHVDRILEECWHCMATLKELIYGMALESRSDGVQLLAIKFIETTIFLFTPDPNAPILPSMQSWNGHGFNISWLTSGHPVLNTEVLGQEADQDLGNLLDLLKAQQFLKLLGPVAIVLVNSLAFVARRRYATYGRILPALIALVPICDGMKGPQRASVVHAVKNALLNLLKCTHSGAGMWREQLKLTLKAMNAGDIAEAVIRQTDRTIRNAEKERVFREGRVTKDDQLQPVDHKRPLLGNGCVSTDQENSGKRMRPTLHALVESPKDRGVTQQGVSNAPPLEGEASPLQQMIDIIGALVAKGERAAASIELLITSLPPDMLADVVIENMKNLPLTAPVIPSSIVESGSASVMVGSGKPQGPTASALTLEPPLSTDQPRRDPRRDPRRLDPRRVAASGVSESPVNISVKNEETVAELQCPTDMVVELCSSPHNTSGVQDVENISSSSALEPENPQSIIVEAKINHEVSTTSSDSVPDAIIPEMDETTELSTLLATVAKPSSPPSIPAVEDNRQCTEPMDNVETNVDLSEEHFEASATGLEDTEPEVLALAAAEPTIQEPPVVNLSDSQQFAIWKMILLRILESYKLPETPDNNNLSFSVLARLISQADDNDEAVIILQNYILADYTNRKGHELAMHILYQLYAEKMFCDDKLDSVTIASTVYEHFLINVAEGLRDTLPPTDKSLSKLLGEAPILPDIALELLESLCNSGAGDKDGIQSPNSDRITQGLSAVWFLILLRPPMRAKCLEIALKCAVHEVDEVRTKAIRLVANKLYALHYAAEKIEDFATNMLHSVVGKETSKTQGSVKSTTDDEALLHKQPTELIKDTEGPFIDADHENRPNDDDQQKASQVPLSVQEAQRCMSLYFALCTKKVPLLWQVFNTYESAPKAVKQAAHRNMPVLVRTIGSSSPELLQLISDPPAGSKNLLLLVLHLLTESAPPSSELIATVKVLYESKIKDARFLIPILSSLSKEEVLPIFPHLVALPSEDFKAALDRILQGSVYTGPALTPAEVLIAIHGIDPEKDHIPLHMVKEACAVCFQQRTVFTQQVLAKVLNQLVEQTPLPMLFMRTVILAVGSFRSLVNFVMEILSRLVTKQIWKWPNLWIGFLKCANQTQPHSFHALLQLPAQQLEKALIKHPNLRTPLTAHASKPAVKSTLARSTLIVLGLAQDALPSEAATSHPIPRDVSSTSGVAMEREISEPTATT